MPGGDLAEEAAQRGSVRGPTHILVGREQERAALDQLLSTVRGGLSGALVLRGDAGVGKTALLDYAAESAHDLWVLRLVGIESEMELAYSGLHQLLYPVLGHADDLPAPQSRALRVAFGSEFGVVDRLLVGLATLTLLATVAVAQPLICVVDDAQWLDRESTNALAFVARRLYADRVGIIIAVRDPPSDRAVYDQIAEIEVVGLREDDALALIADLATGPIHDRVARRLIAETRGNPLALRELGLLLSAAQLAGHDPIPEPLPVGRRLEASFVARVRDLPGATQTLLLTTAADPTGEPELLWHAGEILGFDRESVSTAIAADLLVWGPPIAFRHPLIRSAVYYQATDAARHRVHQALANATDARQDPDRRAWHMAAAADGPDEEIAQGARAGRQTSTRPGRVRRRRSHAEPSRTAHAGLFPSSHPAARRR